MIRNIPNKYTLASFQELIDENFTDDYDFINFPFDIVVILLIRTIATLVMQLLISKKGISSLSSNKNFITRNGQNIFQIK